MTEHIIPVTLTERAIKEVKNIMLKKNIPQDYALRIGIKGSGGCGGFDYILGFDQKKGNDLEYVLKEIPILIEKKHTMYLLGLEVDFVENTEGRGFTFVKAEEENR